MNARDPWCSNTLHVFQWLSWPGFRERVGLVANSEAVPSPLAVQPPMHPRHRPACLHASTTGHSWGDSHLSLKPARSCSTGPHMRITFFPSFSCPTGTSASLLCLSSLWHNCMRMRCGSHSPLS